MTNILEAICNIVEHQSFEIRTTNSGRNRANSMGEALESYIKDAFASTFSETEENRKNEIYSECFFWLGSQNNPPDVMIRGGDAVEVKKTQNANSSLALNSSYPKADIRNDSPMIQSECRECEDWDVKDLIYCIGHTTDSTLKSLWMVYGSVYAAKHQTYQRIKYTISEGIQTIPNVVFSHTKELGRVNQVDPLGITNLRIRGMWQIENPRKVFNYLHKTSDANFELVCIIPLDKYTSFPKASKTKVESIQIEGFELSGCKVKDPNNPANLLDCKLIKFLL